MDSRALRDAFGCFATGVTIVTSFDETGTQVGFTANSFASVSLDPPMLLVCPARTASCLPAIRHSRVFGVNVLSAGQQAIAERFATRGVERFEHGEWVESDGGVLLLEGACANFACSLDQELDAGDHVILLGKIESFRAACERTALMYIRGCYA